MFDGLNAVGGSDEYRVLSPAKINWTLSVRGKRPDGFHEISSLVSRVTLYDELTFGTVGEAGIALACDRSDVPTDGRNLVWRAAELLAAAAGRKAAMACRLSKRIPAGGGLGGGSSNGATTLVALNRMWGLDWPRERLAELAGRLGSDVALFLEQGSAVISGRGEQVRPVTLGWKGWIVLLMPGLHVSTPEVYRAWCADRKAVLPVEPHATNRAEDWMAQTFNMLEEPAIQVCPALGRLQNEAGRLAERPVRVSGSGSTLFTAFDSRSDADAFSRLAAERLSVQTAVVQPVEQDQRA
jgi:4-diphosphocytidyl-2-C-methyl-D-erythritol kinase